MKKYQEKLATLVAQSGALFFKDDLVLKDKRPTPYFVNFGYFNSGKLIAQLGEIMASFLVENKITEKFDVLLGPSYKGSALAVATVQSLWNDQQINKSFEYDRKAPKTHGEASTNKTDFVTGALYDGAKILIIDDVVTTMATKFDILNLLKSEAEKQQHKYDIYGVVLYLNREQSTAVYDPQGKIILAKKGSDPIKTFTQNTGLNVWSVLGIKETIEFLAKKEIPVKQNNVFNKIEPKSLEALKKYWDIYGV